MFRYFMFLVYAVPFSAYAQSSGIISGPWAGNVELKTATIWLEVSPKVKSITVLFKPEGQGAIEKSVKYSGLLGREFNPVKIDLNDLKINTKYTYRLMINDRPVSITFKTTFKTKDLWQYRKPAADFNFLAGSCSYFNEPEYDRPGKPYGMDSSIFIAMANIPAAFNLWLGDNWYTREVDFNSKWGLNKRVSRDRSMKVLQQFMASMPQYHIWDDHDYGPNNSDKSYILKNESRQIFENYTLNPAYGQENKGIYTKVSYSDVDLFLTDNRFFRSHVRIEDSINGKPNPAKSYFGSMQMEWLKNSLLYSNATFKIIATGGQVLNPVSGRECMRFYSYEYHDLLHFLYKHKINGVIFLSGDRHHSEVIKLDRPGQYPLYDITISPLTATVGKAVGAELNNYARIEGTLIEAQNFGNISISGNTKSRKLTVTFMGIKGDKLGIWSINENDITNK